LNWRLYLDEDFMSNAVRRALEDAGFECLTVAQAGRRGQSDESQLSFAQSEGCVLVSANVGDFSRIHAQWLRNGSPHAGMVLVTDQRVSPGDTSLGMRALRSAFPDGIPGMAEYLSNWIRAARIQD
jgi:hypothetical protein